MSRRKNTPDATADRWRGLYIQRTWRTNYKPVNMAARCRRESRFRHCVRQKLLPQGYGAAVPSTSRPGSCFPRATDQQFLLHRGRGARLSNRTLRLRGRPTRHYTLSGPQRNGALGLAPLPQVGGRASDARCVAKKERIWQARPRQLATGALTAGLWQAKDRLPRTLA